MVASTDEPAHLIHDNASSDTATITGPSLRSMFRDADTLLERHITPLNAINVFPVPDGDTGTNMHLTMRAALDGIDAVDAESAAEVASAAAHGALMGARGNSGVILSQVLRGFARGLGNTAEADSSQIAAALGAASDDAYAALAEPKEGTILTVARAAADAATKQGGASASETLSAAAAAAHEAVAQTPELLPALKEAGVVDAGGLGLAIVLEAFARSFRGDTLDIDLTPEMPSAKSWQTEAASMHEAQHGAAGYCTEFVIQKSSAGADEIRARLGEFGGSLLVVGDQDLLRVHVHTASPDDALEYGRTLGEVSQVKVDNMEKQVEEWASQEPAALTDIGVVTVAEGPGIQAAFRSVGATNIVEGGQTMNPSAGEILDAIRACPQDRVVVLPNNKNVIGAAEQAAAEAEKSAAVVPTRSIPQGVAALLALNPDLPFEENVDLMREATASVRSAEVTRAVRATVVQGHKIEEGQSIGIVEGDLTVVSSGLDQAVYEAVDQMRSGDSSLLTVYWGADVREEDAEALAATLRERYPDLEIELVAGGQRHYAYLLSLE